MWLLYELISKYLLKKERLGVLQVLVWFVFYSPPLLKWIQIFEVKIVLLPQAMGGGGGGWFDVHMVNTT